tara:strand:- start:319 stop:759 length:441 start_codon:yes stop_codon:yes gene_type:complete
MNNKRFSYIMIIIGITMISLGSRWLIVEEPWMLDEVANIERLEMTFDELFEPNINSTLPGYLRQIYRFFGLWVTIIGFFIISFSSPKLTSQEIIRKRLLFCMGVMMVMGTILGYALIPSSHFIYLMWIMNILYLFCIYNHSKINHE